MRDDSPRKARVTALSVLVSLALLSDSTDTVLSLLPFRANPLTKHHALQCTAANFALGCYLNGHETAQRALIGHIITPPPDIDRLDYLSFKKMLF
jgi:hypothetical protein